MLDLQSTNNIEISEVYRKVMCFFFSYPQISIGITNLASSISASKNATKEVVIKLISEEFLNKIVIGKSWLITLNPKSKTLITAKIPYNLQIIYQSDIIKKIYELYPGASAIILFGSYRWGTDNENSDIDIAVELNNINKFNIRVLGNFKKLGYRKNIKVNLHIFSRKVIDINLLTNIHNGIILDGFLEVN